MQLSLQNFTTLVQNMAASVQASATALLDLTVGSVLRAILEANASIALWLQWLIIQVLQTTRAATSVGSDLDTWMADFSLIRLPAVAATGSVTFSRYTPTLQALILPGVQVKTADGTQLFTVIEDTTQSAWSTSLGGYVIAAGTTSANATVQAVNLGTQGNVQANTITLLASAIPVDTCTNAAAFTNGINAETDAALRARFANYIQTRSLATDGAVEAAIQGVQQGIFYTISENTASGGGYQPGNFLITVDDGTGSPPTSLINNVSAAVNAVRPIGSTYTVQAAADTVANVALVITTSPVGNKPALIGPVATAITAFIDALPVGSTLYFNRLASIAYAQDPSIVDVSSVTLNSATADLAPGATGVIRAGTVAVS